MNNCFIDSILKSLNNLDKFNNLNIINDELLNNIKNNNSINVNKIVFKNRINNTQEDAEEFLTNKLLPYFKNYNITDNKLINLSNNELNIINEFIQYNKSKIFNFLKKYNYFDDNKIFYEYFYDFYDNIKPIYVNNYIKQFTLADYFTNYYFDLNNNELVKSFTVSIINNNFKEIIKKIYFLKISNFIILNINYIDNTNFIIPNNLISNDNKYNLKSIVYYINFGYNNGHYYTINVNINNKYNAINIIKHSKAKLLFYELE